VTWDGTARFDAAQVRSAQPVNFFNRDKSLDLTGESGLAWKSVTTGNLAGFITSLRKSREGTLEIETPLITTSVPLAGIGFEDTVLDASRTLPRRMRLYRLPEANPHREVTLERRLIPSEGRDNPFYVRATLEDGTQAWSSPVYILRSL
jgi:hypothetical protein